MMPSKLSRIVSSGVATFDGNKSPDEAERAMNKFVKSMPGCVKVKTISSHYSDDAHTYYRIRLEWTRVLTTK